MKEIIGVRFRQAGKGYYFSPGKHKLKRGEFVIVETAKGVEIGTVVLPNRRMEEEKIVAPLKPIIRVATKEDEEKEAENRRKEKEAYRICYQKIHKHKLEMKLIEAEYTFDNNKLLQRMEGLTSVNWLKIWPACSAPVLNCVRSVSETRQRSGEESESAEDRCAATVICQNSCRYPSRWLKSRICL